MNGPLVGLVQHDDGILSEVRVNQALSQQHAVCHVLDDRFWAGAILKSNSVAHLQQDRRKKPKPWGPSVKSSDRSHTPRREELAKTSVVSSSKVCPALDLTLNILMTMKSSLLWEKPKKVKTFSFYR